MHIDFIGHIDTDISKAIEHALGRTRISGAHSALVIGGGAPFDIAGARRVLHEGGTVAILNARAGDLGDLYPGTGCEAPCDLALFAVRRVPIHGHSGRAHTIVTMLPDAALLQAQGEAVGEDGSVTPAAQAPLAWTPATIADELKRHLEEENVLDASLIPPTGAYYGTVTYNFPWSNTLTQSMWTTASGTTQTFAARVSQTYYVYFANGASQAPQYVILMVQQGTASPSLTGTAGLCCYTNGERVFALGTNTLSATVVSGALSLVSMSPSATSTTPVTDTITYPMTVMAFSGGGRVSTEFTAQIGASTDNPDWGVTQTGNPAANEAAWMYYNITGWNASTQTPSNFGQWWAQMYGDGDSVNTLDSQCLNGASFHTLAVWTIPQNPNNAAPLNAQMGFKNTLVFEGFVNCDNSGNGHHQIGWASWWLPSTLPLWDLVAITGSAPDASLS